MFKKIFRFYKDIFTNSKLILSLSWQDLKKRYAGSFGGIVWAYLIPLISILVMWVVFQYGFKSTFTSETLKDIPFILFLTPGYIIWTFINDTILGSTNCLNEYGYLVKQVKFTVSVLPITKIISSFFVHAFFIIFSVVIFISLGYPPHIQWIQIIYFLFATFVLLFGLTLILSTLGAFLKDMNSIMNVVMQIFFWATPIFWSLDGASFPDWLVIVFKINPFYYLITGYRETMLSNRWFWEFSSFTNLSFWIISITLVIVGTYMFKKSQKHFADVI